MRLLNLPGYFGFTLYGLSLAAALVAGTLICSTPLVAQEESSKAEPSASSEPAKVQEAAKSDAETDVQAGQDDLNAAIDAKIDAEDLDALQKVIELCKSAITKGLSESDANFAKEMIGSSALQKAQLLRSQLQEARLGQQGQLRVVNEMEKALKLSLEYDPKSIEAYIQIASVHLGLERQGEALEEITKAIELSEEAHKAPGDLAKLYLTRALMQSDAKAQLADISKASELEPTNLGAWQTKLQLLFASGDKEGTYQAIQALLKLQGDNQKVVEFGTELLLGLGKTDEALQLLNEKIAQMPNSAELVRLRGRAKQKLEEQKVKESGNKIKPNFEEAIADFTAALELSPQDFVSYRWRAEAYADSKKYEEAMRDTEKALSIKPDDLESVLLRVSIATAQHHLDEAIADVERLARKFPQPAMFAELAQLYLVDDRPRLAIGTCDEILKADENYAPGYRIRGDAYLNVGEQEKAVQDLEKCLELTPKESTEQRYGALNNLSWVLSTSPKDEIRNGSRALELALEACELTEYKRPHILSTLAAAYAEKGDFEKAREWSSKAVETAKKAAEAGESDDNDQLDQLEQELKSYQESKPWRELQETKESAKPSVQIEKGVDA